MCSNCFGDRTALAGKLCRLKLHCQHKVVCTTVVSLRHCAASPSVQCFQCVLLCLVQEANAALGMNGMNVAGQNIKVEMAKIAREATPQGASNPYMALQMQQLHQYQLSALQSQSLAAQVANLRALQKSNPAAVMAPGIFFLTELSSICRALVCSHILLRLQIFGQIKLL